MLNSPFTLSFSVKELMLTRLYYRCKPMIPLSVRWKLRRMRARRLLRESRNEWPILESAAGKPKDWSGWPDGKKFAFVLTHDVESQVGLDRVRQLATTEMELGFRSSFNFIPRGSYELPTDLREWLVENGFEVGVHDLHHDGGLYSSREEFRAKALEINRYLGEWDACGFRSGFMMRQLDWLHDLDILYDSSTFDTDPFEPEPDGVHTIFPYWISGKQSSGGYVELPYTLPQDSTLFSLLQEESAEIWLRKLDWIAEKGGMALLNVHPDYICLDGQEPKAFEYASSHYEEFLRYASEKYGGIVWSALPREAAEVVRLWHASGESGGRGKPSFAGVNRKKPKIWIDLDNTPHVPFFEPIIEKLKARGYPVMVTARDAFQVCELADEKKIPYNKVGCHHGRNRVLKGIGLIHRALQLAPLILREKPAFAISHGSRSQMILGRGLGIPTLLIDDYEYSQFFPLIYPDSILVPGVIPREAYPDKIQWVRNYPGIKEDVYAWKLRPDPELIKRLGFRDLDLVITVRPPATEAHYHNPESEILLDRFMERACQDPAVRVVLLPRNDKQEAMFRESRPRWFENGKTVVPGAAVDGLNLLWYSDLVVSGGGTMNREAAALGVPVYSIFRGAIGAVDRSLVEKGRLVLVESIVDVDEKIRLEKRSRPDEPSCPNRETLNSIVNTIVELAESAGEEQAKS